MICRACAHANSMFKFTLQNRGKICFFPCSFVLMSFTSVGIDMSQPGQKQKKIREARLILTLLSNAGFYRKHLSQLFTDKKFPFWKADKFPDTGFPAFQENKIPLFSPDFSLMKSENSMIIISTHFQFHMSSMLLQ